MNIRLDVLGKAVSLPFAGVGGGVLATWVPAKAKNKNKNVPTNSPKAATMLLRFVGGSVNMGSLPDDPFWPASEGKEIMRCGAGRLIVADFGVGALEDT